MASDRSRVVVAGGGPLAGPIAGALRVRGHEVDRFEVAAQLDSAAAETAGAVVHVVAPTLEGREQAAPEELDQERVAGTDATLAAAERAGALLVLISTTLTYADAGDEPQTAPDPVLDPAPWLLGVQESELRTFGSGVRFLILRAGLPLGAGTPAGVMLAELVDRRRALVPDERAPWVPLVHPDDLAELAAEAIERDQNGVWDAVSDAARVTELFDAAATVRDTLHPRRAPLADVRDVLGPVAADALTVSRRVVAGGLDEIGLHARWTWRDALDDALRDVPPWG